MAQSKRGGPNYQFLRYPCANLNLSMLVCGPFGFAIVWNFDLCLCHNFFGRNTVVIFTVCRRCWSIFHFPLASHFTNFLLTTLFVSSFFKYAIIFIFNWKNWKIHSKAYPTRGGNHRCDLCLSEKLVIALSDPETTTTQCVVFVSALFEICVRCI